MSDVEPCPKCGSESVSVARNMRSTRGCDHCGHTWDPPCKRCAVPGREPGEYCSPACALRAAPVQPAARAMDTCSCITFDVPPGAPMCLCPKCGGVRPFDARIGRPPEPPAPRLRTAEEIKASIIARAQEETRAVIKAKMWVSTEEGMWIMLEALAGAISIEIERECREVKRGAVEG